ncbi:amino acid adenylation domain-containing protein [Pseudomonas gingeri]|uniref:amino acid adenylation domain-containing protein n=1 Tax=Pseudomonas gingeri TaxID=117681 RepID=UPI0015A318FF|nr:amino acid adenylation domain-containing protein [Pseudomonas gingeri]NWD04730.1 amino acid adenylation domain-containing protein [Pseudomonas gingeri]NWE30904.1 amino acid adenylation domain-containing protein [Pseudomonas gingeri]NWE58966.1 amino acid adenylation domain-containing protein [Pseudomonas gingeri]NWF02446.1 amino acid adenylation domain-containing protein [Pseudomonas gingeri]
MTFDEIEHTDSVRDTQVPGVESESSTVSQAAVSLERADAVGTTGAEFEASLLTAWLVAACWYANWAEEVSSVVVSRAGHLDCPNVDPLVSASALRADCRKALNDMSGAQHAPWQVRAWSDIEQCQGLFGAAQLQMNVREASVELLFDRQVLEKDLAHEILDTLLAIAMALQSDDHLTPQQLVEFARPVQSNSELLGKLQGVVDQDVLEAFESHAGRNPEKAAICDAGTTISYGQLSAQARKLATELAREGVTAGSRVALRLPRSSGFIIAALALLSLDAIYIPIDLELPVERSKLMLEDARAGWIIEGDGVITRIRSMAETESEGNSGCGYVLFTSGTTGRPKGVMVSRSSLSYYASVARHTFSLTSHARVLQFATVSFDASVEEIYPCLMAGGTLIIRDSEVDLRPARFLQFVHEQRITFLDLPTGYWRELSLACLSENLHFPPSVNLVVIGGEALYKSDIHAWFRLPSPRPHLINSYGPTETTVVTALQRVRQPCAGDEIKNAISIGRPIAGSRIVLLDRFDRPAPLGGMGQICISSPGVATGYLNSPEMTDEKFFIRVESDRSQHRYYKSGDLGRIGVDGALEYHGRMDNVVKRQGFRISLGEIESIVRTLPEVSDCCVLMTDAGSNAKLLCAVQLMPGIEVTQTDLRHQLSLDLPSYMVPNSFVLLDEMPRTLAGKIDYNRVRALATAIAKTRENGDLDPQPESELMAGIRSILGARELNWDASLAENGADSLEIVRLAVFLERHSGREWPVSTLYHCASLRTILTGAGKSVHVQHRARHFRDWRDAELDRLKGLLRVGTPPSTRIAEGILVTGATGLLGRHVVKDLLKRTLRPIHCLVRSSTAESPEALRRKLMQTLNVCHEERQRLHVIVGDLNRDQLGLDEDCLHALQHSVADIVHCAADTHMLSPYSKLMTTNVLGSLNLINLALASGAGFHFVSSLALFDTKPRLAHLSPSTKMAEVDSVTSGYLQSKWMIEMLLEQLRAEGLKATIYRCGRLWGSTTNVGEASNDYVFQFLSVCQRIGQFPIMPMQLEVCPANRIAGQIASRVVNPASLPSTATSTYHLCSSKSYTMDEIHQAMRQQVKDLVLVNSATWLATLNAHILAYPQDVPALRVFAVVKSLSLSDCMDDLTITEAIASHECWGQEKSPGLTPEQMAYTVMAGSVPPSLQAQTVAHG